MEDFQAKSTQPAVSSIQQCAVSKKVPTELLVKYIALETEQFIMHVISISGIFEKDWMHLCNGTQVQGKQFAFENTCKVMYSYNLALKYACG